MRTTFAFTALVASLSAAIAAPVSEGFIGKNAINSPPKSQNTTTDGQDVILWFKAGDATIQDSIKAALDYVQRTPEDDSVNVVQNAAFTAIIMKGVNEENIDAFNAMDAIEIVEQDVEIESYATQSQSTWGLQRISNDAGAAGSPQGRNFTYSFQGEASALGAGVDVYMVDTGIRASHAVFQGRAVQGFPPNNANDGDGHGTHTAGTVAGAQFGVAQGANLIAVKVLGDDGKGSASTFIDGISWAINNHDARKSQPGFLGSVMSMSLGISSRVDSVNRAVSGALSRGVHVSIAAGNDFGKDACTTTPALLGGSNSAAVTVGALNIQNKIAAFSNIGTCVDIYAPGEQILSAWNTGDTIINFLSGTSMACPHVSGVMATLIAQDPTALGQNPAALKAKLLSIARKNAFTGNTGGSANLLLSNGVDGKAPAQPQQKRTVTGDLTTWAQDNKIIKSLGARWTVHSTDSLLRF